jgi:hypothetical protein
MAGPWLETGRFDHFRDTEVDIEVFQDGVISNEGSHTMAADNQTVIFEHTQGFTHNGTGNTERFA